MTPARERAMDERDLAWLALRASGEPVSRFAGHYGVTSAHVYLTTGRILADDVAMSGEPEDVVRAAYWGVA